MITFDENKFSLISNNAVSPSDEFPLLGHGAVFGKCNLVDSGNERILLAEASSLSSPDISFSLHLHQRQPGGGLLSICITPPIADHLITGRGVTECCICSHLR